MVKKVSVIGLSYNCSGFILNFIKSALAGSLAKDSVEVIIVDNASSDGTARLIKEKYPDNSSVIVIEEKDNAGSSALNDALKIATGDYMLFTDTDMLFKKDCLLNFCKASEKLGKDTVLCPTLFDYHNKSRSIPSYSSFSRSFYSYFVRSSLTFKDYKEVFMAGFVFMHRETAAKLGYIFDRDYFLYAEDFDLCARIRLQGMRLVVCRECVMYNMPPSQTTTKYISRARLAFYLERNLLFTYLKICSVQNILLFLPYVILVRACALAADAVTLRFRYFASRIRAYSWILLNLAHIFKRRKETQKLRRRDDSYIFCMADETGFIKSRLPFL